MDAFERPGPTVSLDTARRQLLSVLAPLTPEHCAIDDVVGRVLADAIVARMNVPPFPSSAMDGYAVRAADTTTAPVRLAVVGRAAAGRPFAGVVGPGEAVSVATGASVPDGADAVCMVERAVRDGNEVVVEVPVAPGGFVRRAGSDLADGATVFEPGTVVRPAHVGVLASLGVTTVRTYPRVRVGVLATGDELVEPPGVLAPGQIHDANRHALIAAVRQQGCEPVDLGIVGDDEALIATAFEAAVGRCDVVISSGGVSVGEADHLKAVLGRLSAGDSSWMEVRIKPGKPFGFARLAPSGLPVLCLPGNPVSALVVFALLVQPAVRYLAGHRTPFPPTIAALTAEPLARMPDGKDHYLRVTTRVDADGRLVVRSAGGQSSHQLHALASADALAVVPDGKGLAAGDPVQVMLLDLEGPTRGKAGR